MKNSPKVIIIILNYNGISDTVACLKSLLKTIYPNFSIVVVDNGSKSGEIESLRTIFKNNKKINLVHFNNNLGFSEGNNRIIKMTKSKYIVLLNNDTKVESRWLKEMVKSMECDEKIAACQAKIRSMSYPAYFDYAGAAGGFLDKLGYPYARGRIGFYLEKDLGQYDDEVDLFWGSGTCLMLRRKVLDKVGLLPSNFFFYHEETDLCWRLKNWGYKIVFCPKAVVFHKGAGTSRNYLMKRIYYVHRNNLLMIARNLSFNRLYFVLPIRLAIDFSSIFFYLAIGRPAFIFAVVTALASFFIQFPSVLYERIIKRNKIKKEVEKSFYPFSIFWNCFILRKKKYSDLFDGKDSKNNTISYEKIFFYNKNKSLRTRSPLIYIQTFKFLSKSILQLFLKSWKLEWRLIFRGERSDASIDYLLPTFYQHVRAYEFCQSYISNKVVMDIGCGTGYGSFLLCKRAKCVIAFDRDVNSINRAKEQYSNRKINFFISDIYNPPSLTDKAEVIIALQVIEHLRSPGLMIENALKQLQKEGIFIISTPNKSKGYNKNPYHIKEFSYQELSHLLKKYFTEVVIYGLHGDRLVKVYEKERKKSIMGIFKYDKFGIRNLLPLKMRIILFEFFTRKIRKGLIRNKVNLVSAISMENFYISPKTKESIDLIAVCRN